jgi:hypothetical protein
MAYIWKTTHPMVGRHHYLDAKKSARKSYFAQRPELPSLALILVGVAVFVAMLLLLLSRAG